MGFRGSFRYSNSPYIKPSFFCVRLAKVLIKSLRLFNKTFSPVCREREFDQVVVLLAPCHFVVGMYCLTETVLLEMSCEISG